MFSWAGASKFESGDITEMVARGASGSGEFGSFLADVFGGDAQNFVYTGLKDTADREAGLLHIHGSAGKEPLPVQYREQGLYEGGL